MARLVTKFKYLKPDQEKPVGGYATYIATREGVEKIDESFKLATATVKQQKFIEKILRDFPDSATMLGMKTTRKKRPWEPPLNLLPVPLRTMPMRY